MTTKLRVKRPRALLFDLVATIAKTSFVDAVLLPYIENSIQKYLEENWDTKAVQEDIDNLRWQAKQDTSAPQIPDKAEQAEMITAVAAYVRYCQANNKDGNAMIRLRFHMWFDGFKRDRLETPVYSDAAAQLNKWRDSDIKLYVLCNGWSQATKCFLSKTNHGNLSQLMEDHFDTALGSLESPDTYRNVLDQIKLPAESVLFLTKSPKEGRAAMQAGLNVTLVLTHRRNIEKLDEEEAKIPLVRMLNDLDFIN